MTLHTVTLYATSSLVRTPHRLEPSEKSAATAAAKQKARESYDLSGSIKDVPSHHVWLLDCRFHVLCPAHARFDVGRGVWEELKGLEKGLPRFLCGATMADLDGKLCVVLSVPKSSSIVHCSFVVAQYVAELKAREAVAMRSKVQKEMMLKEKEDAT
ncbi:hypothetical protein Fmac_011651 [Flemingia macrophylla]|uniref:Uncharacterized protein n=1 Tax=Flemingia macrophylla TaxID=520843 RepID=A0ABD1MQ51_9FABA